MELTNLYQVCVFFAIGLMTFSLVISFLGGLGIFGSISVEGGMNVTGNQSDIVGNFTQTPRDQSSFGDMWLTIFGAGTVLAGLGAVGIAIATQNATFVGIFIFSVYFWASYINAFGILSIGGFLPLGFLMLFSIPIGFIFVGAVIGMLSGV